MNEKIKELHLLIVEDENKNIEILKRILLNNGIINIEKANNTEEAIEKIDNIPLDIILLDLRIPSEVGGMPNSKNSIRIIEKVDLHNRSFEDQIKIIIISGTTEDKGLQRIIERDKSIITHMFDKGEMGRDPNKFTSDLITQIHNAKNRPTRVEKPCISLFELRKNQIKKLKNIDKFLYSFLLDGIIIPFEEIEEKIESNLSFSIIVKCGIAVAYLIDGFSLNISVEKGKILQSFSDMESLKNSPMESETSISDKLISLTGRQRKYVNNKKTYINKGDTKISRQAAEFAIIAYQTRSAASHLADPDKENKNIFSDNNFTKDHALVSISLIMPLVQEYIKFRTKQ